MLKYYWGNVLMEVIHAFQEKIIGFALAFHTVGQSYFHIKKSKDSGVLQQKVNSKLSLSEEGRI